MQTVFGFLPREGTLERVRFSAILVKNTGHSIPNHGTFTPHRLWSAPETHLTTSPKSPLRTRVRPNAGDVKNKRIILLSVLISIESSAHNQSRGEASRARAHTR